MHDSGVKFNQNELANLENLRKSVASKILKIKIFCGVLGCVLAFWLLRSSGDFGIALFAGGFVAIFVYGLLSSRVKKGFGSEFKDKIITQIIASISPNLAYEKDEFIEFSEFNKAKIYNDFYDIYNGNDLIYGELEGVEVKFSDIRLSRLVRNSNRPNQPPSEQRLFYGIFFVADFNKFFSAKVVVLDKKNHFAFCNMKKTKMDNSEFNDTFATFCDDEIAARYILTPNLMEKMLYLRKFFGAKCDFCFVENKIYIYINLGKDSFEADYKVPLIGENSAPQRYHDEIMQFVGIVENLKLNSKIFKAHLGQNSANSSENSTQNSAE
ncbi:MULTISPECIES: DUF3137 domain-containing protein [unclassified Campylobacter]|uniref:DUF3137 domain-containing protein n=1 Tax=unclassified Campylobacter TaxID=2593542 RepID=UPI0022E9CA41|nr:MULTISPECIES: DUF3137 domain-containing protein [unclassified Campylobacter]MDA3056629.1 DUF3137 domain-containing protein [Campylobacter sp. CN_NA1]MDA3065724.1 DUF3137 domain-containing protein [Campylobacter sp. CN_NE4]MDA3069009.1 DUF3137 domain-containing protein [Campylobacter sp. CN_NE3]MDA3083177.1 DUF3137 domain-containing protein [Campylobacter sp. CN_EL2]MDA3084649.1 DUF3137 domain-containing protein [Campylobacter sp. CN_NE1]